MKGNTTNEIEQATANFMAWIHDAAPAISGALDYETAKTIVTEVLGDVAGQRWMEEQISQTGIRAMEFRNGAHLELEPARDMLALWVGACRGLIGDAPNYSETPLTILGKPGDKISMDVKLAETPVERYTITVQRDHPDAVTPHQARERAEKAIGKVWQWIADVNDGAGYDSGDLGWTLEKAGFPPPDENEKEGEEE